MNNWIFMKNNRMHFLKLKKNMNKNIRILN